MMVGIIANLRRGFEYVGGEGVYNPTTLQENPSGEGAEVEGKRAMFAFDFASITNLYGVKHITASNIITALFI